VKAIPTSIPGVLRLELNTHTDPRGTFTRVFDVAVYEAAGLPGVFAQDNCSVSGLGVLRGLHYQRWQPQGKLVGVLQGAIFDVVVDLRQDSPTFGHWEGLTLDAQEMSQLWVPPGLAHGFCVLRAPAVVHYRCTAPYDPEDQRGIRWNDPDLAIEWPVATPELSERDAALPQLREVDARLLF